MVVDKITFVTDLRGGERHAYRTAARLARKFGALLQLVHFVEQGGRCRDWAEEQLRQTAREESALRNVRVQTIVLGGGDPYETLSDLTARENAELVICAHCAEETNGRRTERILPERLADACAAPLLVLLRDDANATRPELDELGPRRILLPHELRESEASGEVVRSLASEARHVSFLYFSATGTVPPDALDEGFRGAGRREGRAVRLGRGPLGPQVVKKARALNVDLVVVGTDADGAHAGPFSEDDLAWILRHAPCSVLAIKMPAQHEVFAPAGQGSEYYCG